MTKTYYVTTPIYYVNDSPHIGHSYTTIAADVLARFHRAMGHDVHFLTGTDEHGIKIVKAAGQKSITPRELADTVVTQFQDLWKDLDIQNDDFIRTSQARHESRVQELIRRLVEKDQIYLGSYEGWYDEGQEEFVTESVARENEYKSAISGKPLVRYGEPTYFFRLSRWVQALQTHIEQHPEFVQPPARRNEVLSKLQQGVEDLSISRQKDKLGGWGVPMPNDPTHTVYVWIDALSNYYTALGLPPVGDEFDRQLERFWPCNVHLIGKDILWFHAVYWPCMLMALDVPLPQTVFAHGWWTSEGKKMSKSLGNFISQDDIRGICRDYGTDVYRYFLLRAVAFGTDGDFSRDMLKQRYNADLANGVGNLLSRTVNMIGRYFDGAVPPPAAGDPQAAEVLARAEALRNGAAQALDRMAFHEYLDLCMGLADATNRYIDQTAPFKLAKDDSQRGRLGAVLYNCAQAVAIVLLYLGPVMPRASARGLAQLGYQPGAMLDRDAAWGALAGANARARKAEGLFPRKT